MKSEWRYSETLLYLHSTLPLTLDTICPATLSCVRLLNSTAPEQRGQALQLENHSSGALTERLFRLYCKTEPFMDRTTAN